MRMPTVSEAARKKQNEIKKENEEARKAGKPEAPLRSSRPSPLPDGGRFQAHPSTIRPIR